MMGLLNCFALGYGPGIEPREYRQHRQSKWIERRTPFQSQQCRDIQKNTARRAVIGNNVRHVDNPEDFFWV
jgi:hypothetical protein